MKKLIPFLGAALFFVIAQVVMGAYGLTGGVIAGGAMLALWWASYVWKERVMDRLWHQLSTLPPEKRTEVLAKADHDVLEAMVKRDAKKEPIQASETTRGK
jgi:hypothetical protein